MSPTSSYLKLLYLSFTTVYIFYIKNTYFIIKSIYHCWRFKIAYFWNISTVQPKIFWPKFNISKNFKTRHDTSWGFLENHCLISDRHFKWRPFENYSIWTEKSNLNIFEEIKNLVSEVSPNPIKTGLKRSQRVILKTMLV